MISQRTPLGWHPASRARSTGRRKLRCEGVRWIWVADEEGVVVLSVAVAAVSSTAAAVGDHPPSLFLRWSTNNPSLSSSSSVYEPPSPSPSTPYPTIRSRSPHHPRRTSRTPPVTTRQHHHRDRQHRRYTHPQHPLRQEHVPEPDHPRDSGPRRERRDARTSGVRTPPSRARMGKMWPGLRRSMGLVDLLASNRIVVGDGGGGVLHGGGGGRPSAVLVPQMVHE